MLVRTARRRESGFSLVELLVALMLIGLSAAVTLPALAQVRRRAALDRSARLVGGLMAQGRAMAVLQHQAKALVFERRGMGWRCFLAEDGNGDGVNRRDLRRGRDRVVGEVLELESPGAGLGILAGEMIPDPGGRGALRGDLHDPVRAGRGDIITFTPEGTATPCSVYFSDHHSRMRVLRVMGTTGRVRAMSWRVGEARWRRVRF